jgi:hypothetical protein
MDIEQLKDDLKTARTQSLSDLQKIADRFNALTVKFDVQVDFDIGMTTIQPISEKFHKHLAENIWPSVNILKNL